MGAKKPHRTSSSFSAQQQKERAQQFKQEKIDNFMARQNNFEKRKEKNLKKLTKDQLWKERNAEAILPETNPARN